MPPKPDFRRGIQKPDLEECFDCEWLFYSNPALQAEVRHAYRKFGEGEAIYVLREALEGPHDEH